jgi:ADP-ribose pyrophosphatase YjhB (NUDIX family)
MKFCSECGAARIAWRVPDGDTAPRDVCEACGTIHYRNPKIVVGCLATHGGEVLLCRRAIEPRLGLWTLPAGFMENGETLAAGAMRETLEEANARVDVGELYTVISLPAISQVYMMFRSRLSTRITARAPRASRSGCSARTRSRGSASRSARSRAPCARISWIAATARSAARVHDRAARPARARPHGRRVERRPRGTSGTLRASKTP